MCGALVPILVGVGALALLGGSGGSSNYQVTIPQESGQATNAVAVCAPAPQYAPQPQYAYAPPAPSYGAPAAYAPSYAPAPSPAGHYDGGPAGYGYAPDAGASIDVNGQSAVGAGVYSNPNGTGVGANVGGIGVGLGAQSY